MVVTDIIEITKAKSRIFIDGEFAFVLYKGELRLYHIRVGQQIEEEDYKEIVEVLLPKRAKKRCLMLLEKKDYTEEELRRKLREGEYTSEMIEQAIDYVKGYGYVDDYRYCVSYITCYASQWSKQKMIAKLRAKGVEKNCVEQAYEQVVRNHDIVSEDILIRKILQKKQYDLSSNDYKAKQKMYQHLLYKGFSADAISKILNVTFT